MTVFLILAAALLAAALLLVLPPLMGKGAQAREQVRQQQQAETALLILREQLAELDEEHAAGRMSETEYARACAELEQRALDEGQTAEKALDVRPSKAWALALLLAIPAAALGLYLVLGEPDGLDPTLASAGHGEGISAEEMGALVTQLAQRLEAQPDDITGWVMLARSYILLNDPDGAIATWRKIGSKAPKNAALMVEWADVLTAAQQGDFSGEPDRLIGETLEQEPANIKGLALAGSSAFRRGDFLAAASIWERILTQVPPAEPVYASVLASINEARQKGGLPPLDAAKPAAAANTPSSKALTLRGTVSVAPAVQEKIKPDQTVFVFIRPLDGGMPLAALRLRAGDLPTTFDFADAALMQGDTLPAQVVVGARVSLSGDAMPQTGDPEGIASAPLALDAQGVVLVIDRIRD